MRERTDIENLKSDMQRLQERVKGIATVQQDLHREMEVLRASCEKKILELKDGVSGVDRALKATDGALKSVKREVIDDLSERMAGIMRSRATRSSEGARGYEHIVREGETLSEIASAYKVSLNAIIDVNDLKQPDSIRAGQKLFIPE